MIDHLLTYRLQDFILFDAETYRALVDQYNADIFPTQVGFFLLALLIVYLLKKNWSGSSRAAQTLLALSWIFTGVVFHFKYFITINWGAIYTGIYSVIVSILISIHIFAYSRQVKANLWRFFSFSVSILLPSSMSVLFYENFGSFLTLGTSSFITALVTAVFYFFERTKLAKLIVILSLFWCLLTLSIARELSG